MSVKSRQTQISTRIYIIVTLLFLSQCFRYHMIQENKIEQKNLPSSDRIALIGFYPFKYQTILAGSHSITMVTDLDFRNPTSLYIPGSKRLEDFPVKGVDPAVTSSTVKAFVDTYRSYVGMYGESELRKLVQWTGEPGVESFAFKKRDVDYYVLATHGPENDEQNYPNSFRYLFSVPFSVLTLGTIPVWGTRDVESHFFIYDHRLNLVAKKDYSNKYTVFNAWWGRKEEGSSYKVLPDTFRTSLYKKDIEDFIEFFPTVLPPTKK